MLANMLGMIRAEIKGLRPQLYSSFGRVLAYPLSDNGATFATCPVGSFRRVLVRQLKICTAVGSREARKGVPAMGAYFRCWHLRLACKQKL
jgi:hypothetical protein